MIIRRGNFHKLQEIIDFSSHQRNLPLENDCVIIFDVPKSREAKNQFYQIIKFINFIKLFKKTIDG